METLLADVGFFAIVLVAIGYVYGFGETIRFVRSIPRLRIRLRVALPDALKRDAQNLARLRVHPMDRTFNKACDW
jgi:hypothetical protein